MKELPKIKKKSNELLLHLIIMTIHEDNSMTKLFASYNGDLLVLIVILLFCLDSPVSYPPYVFKLPITWCRKTKLFPLILTM